MSENQNDDVKFEKALERLEKIVEELESGEIPLEDALKKYEEGVGLSRVCQKKLGQAEKKIEMLTRNLNGDLEKVPFEYDEEESGNGNSKPAARKKGRKETSAKDNGEGDDLLI